MRATWCANFFISAGEREGNDGAAYRVPDLMDVRESTCRRHRIVSRRCNVSASGGTIA
jgi:hypothetical protein